MPGPLQALAASAAAQPVKPQTGSVKAGRDFEAMFATEMVRLARPKAKAAGVFAGGFAEENWQVFMNQELGKAVAAKGGLGLAKQIEKALRAQHGQSGVTP